MSFLSKIETFFEKLGGGTWEQKASSTITVCSTLLQTVLALAGQSTAAVALGAVVSQVQSDLAAVQALAASATSNGGAKPTVASIFAAVQTNLKTLLTSADVKNSGKQTEIESIVNTVLAEIEAILAAV